MTTKQTWNENDILRLYKTLRRNPKAKTFMFKLFYDILEHDSVTAREKAKKSLHCFPILACSIAKFGEAFENVSKDLVYATKNSDKY